MCDNTPPGTENTMTDEDHFHEQWEREEDERDYGRYDDDHPCPACDGEGMIDFGTCTDCGGDGTHLAYQ